MLNHEERQKMIARYTTLGLGVVGLDWTTARRIATGIVDEKYPRSASKR